MPGDDHLHWSEQFCTGCQQVTWHYSGRCSNSDFHQSATAYSLSISDAALAAAAAAAIERAAPEATEHEVEL